MRRQIRKLAIVGASARAAAFSALRAGYEVVTADLFADVDLRRVVRATRIDDYPHGLAAWLETVACDGWLYTGALENHPGLVTQMNATAPLLGNGGPELRRVRDPMSLSHALAEAGVAFPETRVSGADLPWDGSWLCKTYRGSSGSGVWRLDGRRALERAQREHAAFQRYVPGEPHAAVYVTGQSRACLLGVTQQIVGGDAEHPWRYVGSLGPIQLGDTVADQLDRLGLVLSGPFKLRGFVGVDFVYADGRVEVIELNPRYSASVEVLESATGVPAIAAHVAACDRGEMGGSLDQARAGTSQAPGTKVHAKRILFARRDADVTRGFFEWAMSHSSPDSSRCQLADIPGVGETIAEGRPVLTAFAAAASAAECELQMRDRVAEVESRLYGGQ
jgi:uncharacterized protein